MSRHEHEIDIDRHNQAWRAFVGHDDVKVVREGFWPKMLRFAAQLPFAEQALAAWYCAFDPATPARVKTMLLAALAYFVLPVDLIPDLLPGIGFTDDLTVIVTTISLLRNHITAEHRNRAKTALARLRRGEIPGD